MKVPLLDLRPQLEQLGGEIERAVLEVIASTRYIGGPRLEELERAVAEYTGTAHAVGVSSGTDALLIALMALDVGPGDIVVTTPYSFFATAGTIARVGATPVFVDIDPDTYNMRPDALAAWLDGAGEQVERVKAVMPVHLYGQCADMQAILEIVRPRGIAVIEDAAQAIGARCPVDGELRKAGSMGTFGCFSFFPSKNLGGVGDGGMVVTADANLDDKLRRLRNHGAKPKYYHAMIGGNFRLDPIQAAVLLVKLPHLDPWHARRQANAAYYDKHLELPGIRNPVIAHDRSQHIYNQYVLSVPERRDELREFLATAGIGSEVYYPVAFHEQQCFEYLGYRRGQFPDSEHAARHTIAIPIYPELTTDMQDHVIRKIGEFYG